MMLVSDLIIFHECVHVPGAAIFDVFSLGDSMPRCGWQRRGDVCEAALRLRQSTILRGGAGMPYMYLAGRSHQQETARFPYGGRVRVKPRV